MNIRYDMVAVFVLRPTADDASFEALQLRRAKADDRLRGTWQTVRGKVEPDEPAWRAALRELREETSLRPIEFYKLSTMESFYLHQDETVWHVACFAAIVGRDDEIALDREHDASRWIAFEDAPERFMWATEWPVLEEIRRVILDGGPSKPLLRIDLDAEDE